MVARIIKSKYVVYKDDIKFVYAKKNRLTMRRSNMIVASLTVSKVESESLLNLVSGLSSSANPNLLEISEIRRDARSRPGDGEMLIKQIISELKDNQILFARVKPDSVDILTPAEIFYRELVPLELYFNKLGFCAVSNSVHHDNYLLMVYTGNL